jgi:microcystin-dependent protein
MSIVILSETIKILHGNNITFLKGFNVENTNIITLNSGSRFIMKNTSTLNLPASSRVSFGNISNTLETVLNNQIPLGSIIIWSGFEANIPTGWAPCYGGIINGVEIPDLRNLFIIGASPTYNLGVIGGNTNNRVVLQASNLPSHSHTGVLAQVNASHSHTSGLFASGTEGPHRPRLGYKDGGGDVRTSGVSVNHKHVLQFASVGSSTPVNIIPPYYSLIYIIAIGT